jgi:hypothetical protein
LLQISLDAIVICNYTAQNHILIFEKAILIFFKICANNIEMTDEMKTVGSKAEVYHQTAKHTVGYLYKKDLMKTKKGRIVSRRKHEAGKKAIKRLFALGYKPTKGTFKVMRKSMAQKKKTGRRTRRR